MSNFKLVKTAAALALGASVVTTSVATTDASAASKYKIKSGKLYVAKTGKLSKGYVTYKSIVYKNGKKLTGLKGKTYYKAGKKATGTYKGAYYVKGVKKVTTGTYNKAYYVKGVKKVTTGLYSKKYYKDGKLATGTYKGVYYVKGINKVTTGTYAGSYYVKGVKVVSTGLYNERLYQAGKLSKGYALYKSILYKDSYHNEGLALFEGKLYDGVSLNKGLELFEGKLYNGSVLSTGFVKHNEKFYNNGVLANGEFEGVEYKDGVIVKYEVKEAKTINANEVTVQFSEAVSADTALEEANYQLEVNGGDTFTAHDVQFVDGNDANTEGTKVIVRLDQKLSAGDKVVVQVKDKVKTVKGKSIERFASDVFTFDASAKPSLVSTTLVGDKLQFTFDRPVDVNTGLIKVDGVALTESDTDLVGTDLAGNYTYTTSEEVSSLNIKEGTHEVTIFDVAETARNNSQVSSVLSGTYTVSKDEQAPEVKSITAQNANRFVIEFTEPVTLNSLNSLVIKQGNHAYDVVDASGKTTSGFDELVGLYADSNAYITSFTNKSKITVVIPEAPTGKKYANPLYLNDAKTATLDVTTKAFKDNSNLVGIESTKQVVLKKDDSTPFVKATEFLYINDDSNEVAHDAEGSKKTAGLIATFDAGIELAVADNTALAEKIVVKNADGIVIPYKDTPTATVNYTAEVQANNEVKVKITNAKYQDSASYSVTFTKEVVKYKQELGSVSGYNFEQSKNKELTVTASKEQDSNFKYYAQKFSSKVEASNNVFKLTFGKELNDTALNPANYTLDGKALPANTKIAFVGDKKTVQISLPEQSVKANSDYKLAISTNVKTADNQSVVNNLRDLDEATAIVSLTDNVSPTLDNVKYLVKNTADKSTKTLQVTFNEELGNLDADDVKVLIGQSTAKAEISTIVVGKGEDKNIVVITLKDDVNISQDVTVTIVKGDDNEIKSLDKNGNKVAEGTTAKGAANVSVVDTELTGASDAADQAAADQAAAAPVITKITELPAVDTLVYATDKTKVDAARTAFDALTPAQKALVTNKTTLEAAEAKIVALGKVDAATATVTAGKYALTGDDVTWTLKDSGTSIANDDNAPVQTAEEQTIVLVATATVSGQTATKEFTVTIPAQ